MIFIFTCFDSYIYLRNWCILGDLYIHGCDAGLAEEGSEEESLAREVEELRSRQRLLPDRIAEVQQALDVEANKYIRRKAKLDSKEGVQKDVERGLKKIIDAYSKHLGLILSPRNDGIEIAFSQIDRNDPNRTFFIRVYCDDDNVYSGASISEMNHRGCLL
jgi:hypothetical protein